MDILPGVFRAQGGRRSKDFQVPVLYYVTNKQANKQTEEDEEATHTTKKGERKNHPPSPVIKLGLRHPRKKKLLKERRRRFSVVRRRCVPLGSLVTVTKPLVTKKATLVKHKNQSQTG